MIASPSKIVLPSSMTSFFSEPGYCESTFFESRRNARLRIRCEAAMTILKSPPSIVRQEHQAVAYVKDISRRGIGILSHQQLFPEEKLLILFQQRELEATVVRCRRLGDLCWESGAVITVFKNLEVEDQ